jgi:hypothetical protein
MHELKRLELEIFIIRVVNLPSRLMHATNNVPLTCNAVQIHTTINGYCQEVYVAAALHVQRLHKCLGVKGKQMINYKYVAVFGRDKLFAGFVYFQTAPSAIGARSQLVAIIVGEIYLVSGECGFSFGW